MEQEKKEEVQKEGKKFTFTTSYLDNDLSSWRDELLSSGKGEKIGERLAKQAIRTGNNRDKGDSL